MSPAGLGFNGQAGFDVEPIFTSGARNPIDGAPLFPPMTYTKIFDVGGILLVCLTHNTGHSELFAPDKADSVFRVASFGTSRRGNVGFGAPGNSD